MRRLTATFLTIVLSIGITQPTMAAEITEESGIEKSVIEQGQVVQEEQNQDSLIAEEEPGFEENVLTGDEENAFSVNEETSDTEIIYSPEEAGVNVEDGTEEPIIDNQISISESMNNGEEIVNVESDMAESDSFEEELLEEDPILTAPFQQSVTIDEVVVSVEAEDVFPADARLDVQRVSSAAVEEAELAVEEVREDDVIVAESYTFDVSILDAEGIELQPTEGQSITISFSTTEVADVNLETNIYHIEEDGSAEQLETETEGETVTAETEGFSLYTVEFTYNSLQYIMPGDTTIALQDILTCVGLEGEVTDVQCSDLELFSATYDESRWIVTVHQAFTSEEWMKVTINNIEYEVKVTDSIAEYVTSTSSGVVYNGQCGENVNWTLNNEGILVISGSGEMARYGRPSVYYGTMGGNDPWNTNADSPWYNIREQITSVIISDQVTTVGRNVFRGCSNLNSVQLGNDITRIDAYAFDGCNLSRLEIPSSVQTIYNTSFAYCDVSEISVDENNGVFDSRNDCNAIIVTRTNDLVRGCENTSIPSTVTKIWAYAFSSCSGLTKITIPESITNIGENAFYNCSNLKDVYYLGSEDEWNAIQIGAGNNQLLNATIHFSGYKEKTLNGVMRQGDGWALKWKVTYKEDNDGTICEPKLEISMDGTDPSSGSIMCYNDADGNINPWLAATGFAKEDFTQITLRGTSVNPLFILSNQFAGYSGAKSVYLNNIETISSGAFEGCAELEIVSKLDNSLYSIGASVFKNCTKLRRIDGIDSAKEFSYIGKEAFANTAISEMTLGKKVTTIGENAFSGCDIIISCYYKSYAHIYAEENSIPYKLFPFEKSIDAWSFSNSYDFFAPQSENYYLTRYDYNRLTSRLTPSDKEIIDRELNEDWGGSCHGMSTLAAFVRMGGLTPSEIQSGRQNLRDVTKTNNDSVESIINYYHMQQYFKPYSDLQDTFSRYSAAQKISILNNYADNSIADGTPFLIAFSLRKPTDGSIVGHTIVGCYVEHGEFSTIAGTFDSRLLTYDCNYPEENRPTYIYYNRGTDQWYIPDYNATCIKAVFNNFNIIDAVNYNEGNRAYRILRCNGSSAQLTYNGQTYLVTADYYDPESGISAYMTSSSSIDGSEGELNIIIPNTVQSFEVTPQTIDSGEVLLQADDSMSALEYSSLGSITFENDNSVLMSDSEGEYSITYVNNDISEEFPWNKTSVKGSNAGSVKVSDVENGVLLEGDDLNSVFVAVSDEVSEESLLINSDESSVLITCVETIDETKTVAVTDMDDDGVYETEIGVFSDGTAAEGSVAINDDHFSDDVFRAYVSEHFDKNKDGVLSPEEIANVKSIAVNDARIESLKGIEHFPDLVHLWCYACNISELDVSANTKLVYLQCNENQLTTLDVSNNPSLRELYCQDNNIESLILGNNGSMTHVDCSNNNLSSIDVTGCSGLTNLICKYNNLTELDIRNNQNLYGVYCGNNNISSIKTSVHPNLIWVHCNDNNLSNLDLTPFSRLEFLECSNNQIRELDLYSCRTTLNALHCAGNPIESLDIRSCIKLFETIETAKYQLKEKDRIGYYNEITSGIIYNGMKGFICNKTTNVLPEDIIKELISIPVSDLKLDKTSLNMTVGKTAILTVTITPSDAENKKVTWISSDTKVIIVDVNGKATAKGPGTATITVKTDDGGKTATCNVTVTQPVTGIKLNKTTETIVVGKTATLTATVSPTNATNKKVTWSSSNTAVAAVNASGIVTAKKAGTAKITAKAADGSGKTAVCTVTVKAAAVAVTGVKLNKTALTMGNGQSDALTATVSPWNATNKKVTWKSSNTKLAAVSSTGKITTAANANGTVKITATTADGNKVATCTVTVKKPSVSYRTHVQTFGWQGYVKDGAMSGTSGQAKRLEGINIKLSNLPYSGDIVYRTHVQTYGWQGWKKNGAMSGTEGQAKRLEGIQIYLTGELAKHYDVYYRVHAQTYGWLDYAKNGVMAGTSGLAKRLEGINIFLVPKGGKAPGATTKPYVVGGGGKLPYNPYKG